MRNLIYKKRLIQDSGQSLVELAITLPILCLLIFAMIGIGFYIFDMSVYTFASNKALDRGIGVVISGKLSQSDKEAIKKDAIEHADVSIFTSEPVVEVLNEENKSTGEMKLTVSIQSDYNFKISFVNNILGNDIKVSSKNTYIYKNK